jgi:mannosyltransferase OCH1-like enzyme
VVGVQLCILNLIENANAAGFKVNLVNSSNAHQFIPKETLDIIDDAIKNAKMGIWPQTKSDFYRLALLSTHGGIYLDSTYFFLEDFSWITEISK